MEHFTYIDGELCAEARPLSELAERFGTPCYVYSRAHIEAQWRAYAQAFSGRAHLICYAVKANSNIAVLNLLARLGSGFDIVSVGELERVLRAGGDPARVIFSGVGKKREEMQRALELGIKCFNVESRSELLRLDELAGAAGLRAPVSLRVNPDVDANTHPYIATGLKESKFGVRWEQAISLYREAARLKHIDVTGVDCHIGSQITEISPFAEALAKIMALVQTLKTQDIQLRHIDIGGGLGIAYQQQAAVPSAKQLADAVYALMPDADYEILLEPGRSIVGNAGVLLTRVEYLKESPEKHFAVVDAAMNDLLRPALYKAWQDIRPVLEKTGAQAGVYDVVGPVCESGDFLGLERKLSVREGDLLAISSSGAYAFSMSSNYNTRPRAAEIMVDGNKAELIRQRESIADLMAGESLIENLQV